MTPAFLTMRLSVLVFLGFVVLGSWFPLFPEHAKQLGFSAQQLAWASGTHAIGSLIAPVIWGQIADRWLATERCISLCALAVCAGLWLLSTLTTAWTIIPFLIVIWMFLIPALGLTTALIFRQLEHPERDFGKIRLWGTVGWVVAGWCLTAWWWLLQTPADYADSMRLGSIASFVLSLYALTLPHTPPRPHAEEAGRRSSLLLLIDAPIQALLLFRDRSFAVYAICMFGVHVTMPFTIQLNPMLLMSIGIERTQLPVYMTVAQSLEIVMLAILPMVLMRFGMKTTMLAGSLAWTFGLTALGVGAPLGLVFTAMASHGIFIVGFLVAGQVFVNRQASHDIRASAQALLLLIVGFGQLLGHLFVGWIRATSGDDFRLAYWVAAGISAALLVTFATGFRTAHTPASSEQPAEAG